MDGCTAGHGARLLHNFDSCCPSDYDLPDAICQRPAIFRSLMQNAKRPHLLGFWTCVALVVGNTIGSGVFLLPASAYPEAGGLTRMSIWRSLSDKRTVTV